MQKKTTFNPIKGLYSREYSLELLGKAPLDL